jgi:CubicO group peptidase (beta-lactamase class C family)
MQFTRNALIAPLACGLLQVAAAQEAAPYFPPRGNWQQRDPALVGMSPERLTQAVDAAKAAEASTPIDLRAYIASTLANEPHGEIVGPVRDRGPMTGLVIRGGYLVAQWGDPSRVDMTFSVSKTYLSTVVGLAWDRELIPELSEPVAHLVPTRHFADERGRTITWDHLLRQTSNWRGELFGKYDWADRPPRGVPVESLPRREVPAPGASWKYNDVRVNLLAFAALQVLREPLPVVLRREVMDPIGASPTWRWHGYTTSWVELDGQRIQSVSGGGHWGGGMQISAWDQARFGYLFLRGGRWDDRQLISEAWIERARTPTDVRPTYGFMNWFLNTADAKGRRPLPSCPEDAVTFRGAGANIVYIDAQSDLLIVLRWVDSRRLDGVLAGFLAALE